MPLFIATTLVILVYSTLVSKRGMQGYTAYVALGAGLLCYFMVRSLLIYWTRRAEQSEAGAESIFKKLQIGTACYVAFAHGSNDVSNSISPVLAIFLVLKMGSFANGGEAMHIPIWILLLGGTGMSLGIGVLGHKVIATLGKRITLVTNSRGFSIDFSTATTVVLATMLGMPVSSTHAATGSVIGVGLERGRSGVNFSVLAKIITAWIITLPSAAGITILIYSIIKYFVF